jgi:hypothetical protein
MNAHPEIDPTQLVETRVQLHWAAQILSAAADACLSRLPDDSHSNLAWNSAASQLDGRLNAAIDVVKFRLIHDDSSIDLRGLTLIQGMNWLGDRLGQKLRLREYEMPTHEVADGIGFQPNNDHLRAIADWFTLGQSALAKQGELRIWPHHFDLGFLRTEIRDDASIGGGFSAGDEHFALPYFYVNPYGIDRPKELPPLEIGFWSDKWFGAVITADELNRPDRESVAGSFVDQAVAHCIRLLRS